MTSLGVWIRTFRLWPSTRLGWLVAFGVLCVAIPTVARMFAIEVGPLAWVIAFTPYVAIASLVGAGLCFATRSTAVVGCALVCAVLQLSWVAPLFVGGPIASGPIPAESGETLTVMTSNILVGRGDTQAVVDLVRDHRVDMLAMEELTPDSVTRLKDAGLNELLPHRWMDASIAGMGIWSRYPLAEPPLGSELSWPAIGRKVLIPGLPLTFIAVHPAAPLSPSHTKWTQDQPKLRNALNSVTGPVVVAGDFNATLDHGIMRQLQGDGFVDAAESTGSGVSATWPQGYRAPFPLFAIDHVMHRSVAITPLRVETAVVPRSDHRAVIATYVRQ